MRAVAPPPNRPGNGLYWGVLLCIVHYLKAPAFEVYDVIVL